jgi:hypothetical protein
MIRRIATIAVAAGLTAAASAALVPASSAEEISVYKTPWCGCCNAWADHLRDNGFSVTVTDMEDLAPLKAEQGVPVALQSCHTAIVDGYTIEGHVPASDIARLLVERPDADGLAVPGMPIGSPGMEQGDQRDPYSVILFGDGGESVFSRH